MRSSHSYICTVCLCSSHLCLMKSYHPSNPAPMTLTLQILLDLTLCKTPHAIPLTTGTELKSKAHSSYSTEMICPLISHTHHPHAFPSPSSLQPSFHCATLGIWLFWIPPISGFMQSFYDGLFHSAQHRLSFPFSYIEELPCSLRLSSIPLYIYPTFSSPAHLPIDI